MVLYTHTCVDTVYTVRSRVCLNYFGKNVFSESWKKQSLRFRGDFFICGGQTQIYRFYSFSKTNLSTVTFNADADAFESIQRLKLSDVNHLSRIDQRHSHRADIRL